jgi:caffeoyl-CoA O-methyltransferase
MKSIQMNEEVYKYIVDRYAPDEKLFEELICETERLEIPLIQISRDQAKFLYLTAKMLNASNALEIGTLTGFSGIHVARGLSEGGKLVTVELEKKHADIAAKYFEKAGLKEKVRIVNSPALIAMQKLVSDNKKFDLIFIDADKTSYPVYYQEAIKLSHKGTVIILDNMLKAGRVIEDAGDDADLRAVQLTNDIISRDSRVESILMTIGDGFTFSIVK